MLNGWTAKRKSYTRDKARTACNVRALLFGGRMKIIFEDVKDEQVELILESYLKGKLYFSDRLKLTKDGEENIKNKVKDLLKQYEPLFDDLPILQGKAEKTNRLYSITWGIIEDLHKLVKE